MPTPAFLLRLMAYKRLSPRFRLGPEDRIALEFATDLRVAVLEGRLKAVWCHVPNQLAGAARASPAAALARAMGLIAGASDYLFLWGAGSAALEAKSDVGRLSESQRDFEHWCAAHDVPIHIFRSADEGLSILAGLGILSPSET